MTILRSLFVSVIAVSILSACSQHTPFGPEVATEAISANEEKEKRHDAERLPGVVWQWVGFTDPVNAPLTINNPEQYTLEFLADGMVSVGADCNRAGGSYAADRGSLQIAFGPMTTAACLPGSLGDKFVQNLSYGAVYFFQDDRLFIDMMADGGTLEFSAEE
ncbi:MAG: META domain-containing protein [Pseudomonadota bacterium]|nr:META domain-containing protein [Pseudomonadota bacterium]